MLDCVNLLAWYVPRKVSRLWLWFPFKFWLLFDFLVIAQGTRKLKVRMDLIRVYHYFLGLNSNKVLLCHISDFICRQYVVHIVRGASVRTECLGQRHQGQNGQPQQVSAGFLILRYCFFLSSWERVHNARVWNLWLFLFVESSEAKSNHYIILCDVILELCMASKSPRKHWPNVRK